MPCIYSRFLEKEAGQWRQIYKALQLLEYVIKHGSERVVDDARAHISTIKMLRNFHYVDDKAKDQGINGNYVANSSNDLCSPLCQYARARRKLWNCSEIWTVSEQSVGRRRRTETSILGLEAKLRVSQREAAVMAGLETRALEAAMQVATMASFETRIGVTPPTYLM